MSQATISELVEIQSGYANYVSLDNELFDDNRNVGRMSRYRPIQSHRAAFKQLGRALQIKDGRCYLLTGSYGTGKSHLCLMFANYLTTPADEPPMPDFFQHYEEVDPIEAQTLRERRQKGRYLIALCAWGGKEDFDEVVLRAIDVALRRQGWDEDFDTHYRGALRKIEQWQQMADAGQGKFLDEFKCNLENKGFTLGSFKKRLDEFDLQALKEFREIHKLITTADYTHDKADLIEITTALLSSQKFKEKFAGLLVMFDEFGDTIERGNLSPKAFQRFAQLCGEPPADCAPLVFVGTAHKALTQYAKGYSSENFHTASDRIKEIPLTADGVEEIIGAIVVPQKSSALWQAEVASRADIFDTFVNDCKRLELFNWLNAPQLRNKVIENIYPMHPMATYALLRLSQDVASNNRSVYSFFSGEAGGATIAGSYGDFVKREEILKGQKLNLYTADRLFDYFADKLKSDNKELREIIRDHIKDYENSQRALNGVMASDDSAKLQFGNDPLVARLLRLMLIHEIIGVPNRADNLNFGLYCYTQSERDALANLVKELVKRDVLYQIKETGVYEFKKSTAFDFDRRVDEWKNDPKNQPQNIVAELNDLVPLHPKNDLYLEAKDYNSPYSEDKRLERRLVRAADLESEKETPNGKLNYFEVLEDEISKQSEFEGLALYVVCETAQEIGRAKNFCARNTSERIVVAIPKAPVPLADSVLELRALLRLKSSKESESFTMQDNAALQSRLDGDASRPGARRELQAARDKLMSHKEVDWHGKSAKVLATDPNKIYDAANRVMENLYHAGRTLFAHDDLNKLHIKADKKNAALKEAIEKLVDYTEPLVIDTSYAQNRGDQRYLNKCLLQRGALTSKKITGTKQTCEFAMNADSYAKPLPALAAMVREIENLGDGKIKLADWSSRGRKPPFGQGPVALALFLACLRRRFGDSIRFKMDDSAVGDMPLKTFDDVLALSEGNYPNAYLSYKPLTTGEKALASQVYLLFGPGGSAAGREVTLVEAQGALRSWTQELPPIARVASLYEADKHPHTASFLDALDRLDAKDAHAFLFEELPRAFGIESGNMITAATSKALEAELIEQKKFLEDAERVVDERISDGVRAIFGVESNTNSAILDACAKWYDGLDSQQRDFNAPFHNNDSKQLVLRLKDAPSWGETFLKSIPASPDYAMRAVREWQQDKVEEYLGRLQAGKAHIEANRVKVEAATITPLGEHEWPKGGSLSFKDQIDLTFATPLDGATIWIAEGGNDPKNPSAARQQVANGEALPIKTNKQLRVAIQDAEGNWSPVRIVQLSNANQQFVPNVTTNVMGERTATLNFPNDKESLKVTCRELFRQGLGFGVVSKGELREAVEAALVELEASE